MTHIFVWKRIRVLLAIVALLALVLVPSVVNGTLAGWNDDKSSTGEFTAGSLNISNLTCTDNSGLLGLGGDQLKLDWTKPANSGSTQLQYTVTVVRTPLIGSAETTTHITESTTYTYTDKRLTLVSLPRYSLTVQANPVGGWTGAAQTVNGRGANLLGIGLVLRCRS
ncbi:MULTISPECIES: hypothetical protein [unclassified Brevibacterium]|uniref:hypothetical protein n=1 Tax=unclassified Brevibacterium TaxID=2614124 RepID=UPI001091F35C|nr:hypothetical protein [Brevibacterium sp. S22]TGD31125.1 hypothetical protein EB835_09780 [Brevibacterium sp. S22]